MLFYFVRHGQTDSNQKQLLAGSGIDVPLNSTGHAQAKRLAKAIKRTLPGHEIRTLVVSPMIRTRETASYLALELGLEPQYESGLVEWNLGQWEGRTFQEFGHLLLGDGDPPLGESRAQFFARVQTSWQRVHSDDKPYLVVSHGAVWLAFQDLFKMPRFAVNNCDLVEVRRQGKTWTASLLPLIGD